MESTRTSPRLAGFASAFLLPVAGASDLGASGPPARREARLLVDADPGSAAALLERLILEAEADDARDDTLALLNLDAGCAAWRRGDPAGALRHFEAATAAADPLLAHRARLDRLCAWIALGLPDEALARREADALRAGPITVEARLVLVVAQALLRAMPACRRAVADLDIDVLPVGFGFVHLVNAGVVLLEANDVVGALAYFDRAGAAAATPEARALVAQAVGGSWGPAVLTMNRGIAVGVQALQTAGDAERAALFRRALGTLDEARAALAEVRAPDRLLADARHNLGAVHLWRGWRARDPEALEAALRNHWAALELYRRRPELRRQAGSQWRALGLCYRASGDAPGDARAQACFDRAERLLVEAGDARALAELDLAEAALRLDAEPDAAVALAVPAALFLDAQRYQLAGAAARDLWSDGPGEDALDDALAAARRAGRGDLAAALVVWRRLGGTTQFEEEGPLPVAGPDASLLTPPPRIRGVSEPLEPYVIAAARRYHVPETDLVGPTTIDLLCAGRPAVDRR